MLLFLIACNDGTEHQKYQYPGSIDHYTRCNRQLVKSKLAPKFCFGRRIRCRSRRSDLLEVRWRVDDNPEPACDYAVPNEKWRKRLYSLIEEGMEKVVVEVKDPRHRSR